jgi:hypothetical protein
MPRLIALRGPVSRALRIMAEADPKMARIRELRRAIADRIEADLALLDALDGDCELEEDDPSGGDINDEPHDPEEDAGAEEDEFGSFLCHFDGTNYVRADRRRRA